MAIRKYFMRWLIRTTSLVQIHTIFAKSYVFYELPIRTNDLHLTPTLNLPGFREILLNRPSEVVRISHLVKSVQIVVR